VAWHAIDGHPCESDLVGEPARGTTGPPPDPETPVIVGAAIVRDGRVLTARRTAPSSMAGGWEFPGGKVEPGETEAQALVRECQEELGVTVRLGGRVGPDVTTSTRAVLRVWWAEVDTSRDPSEPRPLQDHDELRWLAPDELASVDWLPADWPLVHVLADRLADQEPLTGGRVGGAVRVGDTVRRPSGPWTPAVHELLHLLGDAGVPAVPRPLGYDGQGRDVVRFVPGQTVGDAGIVPERFRSPAVLADVGRWLRLVHEVTAGFPAEPRVWRRGRLERRDGAVICHNDVSPHNIVLDDDGGLAAVLDWDMAAPGHPGDDVAFAAWQFVLRHGEDLWTEASGLKRLSAAYGTDPRRVLDRVAPRLRGAVRVMRRGAAAGDPGLRRLLTSGIPEATEAGIEDLLGRRDALAELLTPG
jgi:8-oxo-dGTP diphosphatase